MKKIYYSFLIITILLSLLTDVFSQNNAKDKSKTYKSIRGVEFEPMEYKRVNKYFAMFVPKTWEMVALGSKEKGYSLIVQDLNPEFSLSIMFTIIPDSKMNYEQVINNSKEMDFGKGEIKDLDFINKYDKSNANKKKLLQGSNLVSGDSIVTYYYFNDIKSTIKVNANVIYTTPFKKEELNFILNTVFGMIFSIERFEQNQK